MDFFSELLSRGPVILDGATGTNLQKAGLPTGVCPELWIYEHPEAMISLQKAYVKAGSRILYAPTFTANRIKLAEFGLKDRLIDINRRMVALSREAAEGKAYVAGDLTMTGQQLYPLGDMPFEELVDIYKEQVLAICEEGVDLFVIETMMSLQECRAAVLAVKETCSLPVMVTLTYNDDGRTLFGTPPDVAIATLQAMGVDACGINCSTGPEAMVGAVESMYRVSTIPIVAKPNAGLPELDENGNTVYRMTPEDFAAKAGLLFDAGASVLGGCCGTTPAHIAALKDALCGKLPKRPAPVDKRIVTSERKIHVIDPYGGFSVIGERINPTGKKALQEELRAGKTDMITSFAKEQEAAGAAILDINMGTNGIDEKEAMLRAIYEVSMAVDLPLAIDSSYVEVIEAALRIYPGRALINSISAETEKMNSLLPLAMKYGAMFILLPLSDTGLPKSIEEKKENIAAVLDQAKKIGLSSDDVIVDLLVSTIGADPNSANACFETVEYCKNELHVPTVCGLSNISFGLPQRAFVNTAFFTIALAKGLTMAIANPSQELLMVTAYAADMLLNKPDAVDRYLDAAPRAEGLIGDGTKGSGASVAKSSGSGRNSGDSDQPDEHPIIRCVIDGNKNKIIEEVKKELADGTEPSVIINDYLIAGINRVGKLYEEKRFFLPQLIGGANAMKSAMEIVEPLLKNDAVGQKGTVVFATVEGDIHDIGKNLVVLMLKNYGFSVIDLGKDVPAEEIVTCAIENNASVIGLSALMTTTMMKMKEVVALAKERGCPAKIIIGGACITESFADEIGADGYSADAAECVRLVENLTSGA
ncbi:MAG: homocysteine S-methyltransferase family protein [Lachnospiraceae bacterium]|nr:homocysteine S-methyltransferase family protein [Lachnospiraceae bacterium]